MSLIQATRTRLLIPDYRLARNGIELGILDLAPVRSRARFEVEGVTHEIVADGLVRARFQLIAGNRVIAEAQREALLPLRYRVRAGDRQLTLAERFPGRRFRVLHGSRPIGEIRPRHLFSGSGLASFDADLPVATEIFLLGLALLRWRSRARRS